MIRMNLQKCQGAVVRRRECYGALAACSELLSQIKPGQSGAPAVCFTVSACNERKSAFLSSTSVPSNLGLRYPCCYTYWNSMLAPVGSYLLSRQAKTWRKQGV